MANEDITLAPSNTGMDRIDMVSDASIAEWTKRLDVTEEQLKEAVSAVGDRATDVEMHLKGSRATTNAVKG